MLSRMYSRWAESRGWEVEVTDALAGETAGLKSVTMLLQGRKRLRLYARPNAACIASCASRRSIPTNAATRVLPAWT